MNGPVSKLSCLKHYKWGNDCDGWNLVEDLHLSVKLENMPPHTAEALHFHQQAGQFFFILSGMATFEIDGEWVTVKSNEGLHIRARQKHRILNETNEELEFVLTSTPSTASDRINCE